MHTYYLAVFDEIHRSMEALAERLIADTSLSLAQKRRRLHDEFMDFLLFAYLLGFEIAAQDLPTQSAAPSMAAAMEAAMAYIAGENVFDRIDKHLDEQSPALIGSLAESEYHRVFCDGQMDSARANGAKTKTWHDMGDIKVRDTHRYLSGTELPMDELFRTYDGDSADRPGGFTLAENNAGCRCWMIFR